MTALGSVLRRRFSCSFGWCESGPPKFRDGAQHLAAMPQQNAEILEVLLCQVAEDRKINGVIGPSEYVQRFADNAIDLSGLRDLTEQDLKDLGVLLGHRRKMLRAIAQPQGPRRAPLNRRR